MSIEWNMKFDFNFMADITNSDQELNEGATTWTDRSINNIIYFEYKIVYENSKGKDDVTHYLKMYITISDLLP